jgi:hypothetical protein
MEAKIGFKLPNVNGILTYFEKEYSLVRLSGLG